MIKELEKIADEINSVYRGAPLLKPVRNLVTTTDIGSAYRIQEVNTKRWLGEGRKLTGRKIGLTSEAVQKQLGVDQPDYGMLFDNMLVKCGAEVPYHAVHQAKIEGEIAFVLGEDLADGEVTEEALIVAIDYALPSLEIVGSRIENWDITIFDTVADNASSGLYVLGDQGVELSGLDLVGCGMMLAENKETVSTGKGAACLGSPLVSARWLANKMIEVGRPLRAGDVIMSGALGPMVQVKPGALYELSIDGLGSVSVKFGQ